MTEKYLSRPNPAIYEINTAAWLYELSLKLGKTVHLGDVPPGEWDALKALGMDYVWLMGVWSRSRPSRNVCLESPEFSRRFDAVSPGWNEEDVIGSSYSLSSHEPDPLIGGWEDIGITHRELHKRGMGLVLDFIPNHTGLDHPWLSEHPEYYIQSGKHDYEKDPAAFFPFNVNGRTLYFAHGRDPNFPAWTDTAQLNYFNPALRLAMIECLEKIARHCDGVRCDMAMLELNKVFQRVWGWANPNPASACLDREFWAQAFERVPGLLYIAEAYWDTEWTLQQLGFDFVYDKRLYDRLKNAPPQEVYQHLTADLDYQNKLLRFVENHDEPRSLTVFGRDKIKAAAVLTSTLPGMRLYFQGQMEGRMIHLPLQIRRSKPEAVDADIKAFYDRLIPLVDRQVFHSGDWRLKKVFPVADKAAVDLVACNWKLEQTFMLVIVNLGSRSAGGRVCFQDELSESQDYTFRDQLSPQYFTQNGKILSHPGISFELDAHQAQIFDISPA
jgi:hypothetical protein